MSPNFNPVTFDFSKGDKLAGLEKFWLNFILGTQIVNGVILFISII